MDIISLTKSHKYLLKKIIEEKEMNILGISS
jgi:hypothetical protein